MWQHPDNEWRQRLRAIQESNRSHDTPFAAEGGFKVIRQGTARSKASILPEVHTSRAQEVGSSCMIHDMQVY